MSDWDESRESQEAAEPQESPDSDLSPVGRSSMQGDVHVFGAAPPDSSEDSNIKADQSPEEPSGDDSKGDQPPEEPQSEDTDQNRSLDEPEDSAVDRPTIRPSKGPEHPPEPEKPSVTTEVLERSKPEPPEGWQPTNPEQRG